MSFERRQQTAERRWLETSRAAGRISGKYIYPTPPHVYAPLGGFKELNNKYKRWSKEDNDDR